jgi:predicted GTPase
VLIEIKRNSRKVKNIKRARLLKKCNIEKEESLDQLIKELKKKVSAKTQRLSRYRKRENKYYLNKLFRNFIAVLGRHETKETMRKTEEKLDGRNKEDHERKKPKRRPVGR